jgi:vacuolar-type H+-ATPase subunit I/STV1
VLSNAASKRSMTSKAKSEIERTQEEIEDLQKEMESVEKELETAADEITRKWAEILDDLTTEEVKPRRTDVDVEYVAVGWMPSWLVTYHDGIATRRAAVPAYALPTQETKRAEA